MTAKKRIQITYNPFVEKKKTTILMDNKEPREGSSLYKYQYLHLQSGLNNLFKDLQENYDGLRDYSVEFTGLETDCEDMREAVEKAKDKGFDIDYKENVITRNATERLKELEKLLDELKGNPILKEHIKDNQTFAQLTDNTFDIFVVATMSSGKSTFINAMLGGNLLPAANEATTATIAEITDNKSLKQGKYLISRTNQKGDVIDETQMLDLTYSENISSNLLSTWNSDIDTKEELDKKTGKINIEGNLIGIKLTNQQVKLKLSDTPGPNNSQNENHKIVTLGKIKDTKRNPLIIYVLNGEQLSTNDDNNLLNNIAEIMKEQGKLAQDRFIFVMNKMDSFFKEKENITNTLGRAKKYLAAHNIVNPRIFPISAMTALLLRINELSPNLLDEDSKDELETYEKKINRSDDRDLSQYMSLNSRVKARFEKVSNETLKRTGLPALEAYISDYIEKYNEVYRIVRITKAINLVLDNVRPELDNISSLKDKTEKELEELRNILNDAENKLSRAKDFEIFVEQLKNDEVSLSDKVSDFFTKTQNDKFTKFIDDCKGQFQGKSSKKVAEYKLKKLQNKLEGMLDDFSSDLLRINDEEQNTQLNKLNSKYREFVGELFGELYKDLDVGIRDNFAELAFNINQYFKLDNDYIRIENVVVGQRRRERGFWEKLFSFDFRDYDYTDIVEEQERVYLEKFWKDNAPRLSSFLDESIKAKSEEIKKNAKSLTESYCSELNSLFKNKINEFSATLSRASEGVELENTINEANKKLEVLDKIKQTLTSISSLEAQGE